MLGVAEKRGRLIRIVCSEAVDQIALCVHFGNISTDGRRRRVRKLSAIITRAYGPALNNLEVVPVHVDGMTTRIVVVDDDFHDIVPLNDTRVGVLAVDDGIRSLFPR